jgi:DHA3 family tetracycline resistance protein-like MFS transporter
VGAAGGIVGALMSVLLAGVRLGLPMLLGGALYVLVALVAALTMPEVGFQPAPRGERTNGWREMAAGMRRGAGSVRHSPLLLTILGIAVFAGMASEGFDRLWGAHLLIDLRLPTIGALNPVVWFGVIAIGARLLSIAATEVVRRFVATDSHVVVARVLFAINALLTLGVVAFGLAGSFPLALGLYWAVSVLRDLESPLYIAWLSQRIPSSVRATVLSMSGQLNALGQVAGGPLIGLIGMLHGLRVALVATGIALAPALPLVALARRQGATPETPDTQAEAQVVR